MADCYIGEIRLFAGNYAPENWAICDGTQYNISDYNPLFALIGTTYGGDGVTKFAVPDLRGKVAIGARQGPGLTNRPLASTGGAMQVTLTGAQAPTHTHPVKVSSGTCPNPALANPTGKTFGKETVIGMGRKVYGTGTPTAPMDPQMVTQDATNPTQPHDNAQPYLGLNYIIALNGLWPDQN